MHIKEAQQRVHKNAFAHGFWDTERDQRIKLMLIVSEAVEAFESLRKSDSEESDHIIALMVDEELADIVIRVLDLAEWRGVDLESVIVQKMLYNESRPHLHGKLF